MKYIPLATERFDARFKDTADLIASNLMDMLDAGLIESLSIDHIVRAVSAFCSDMGYSANELNTIVDMANSEVVELACFPARRMQ